MSPVALPGACAGGRVLLAAVLAPMLLATLGGSAKPQRPGRLLLHPARLVMEIPKLEPCQVADNAIVLYNVQNKMISKVDFGLNFDFNISRTVPSLSKIIMEITKCRESVSSNTCELFQTWRFEKNPCRAMNDPNAVWRMALDLVKPKLSCPGQIGSYSLRNYSVSSTLVRMLPLPWEGNVWLSRFSMIDSRAAPHVCVESEMRVHRVRD